MNPNRWYCVALMALTTTVMLSAYSSELQIRSLQRQLDSKALVIEATVKLVMQLSDRQRRMLNGDLEQEWGGPGRAIPAPAMPLVDQQF